MNTASPVAPRVRVRLLDTGAGNAALHQLGLLVGRDGADEGPIRLDAEGGMNVASSRLPAVL